MGYGFWERKRPDWEPRTYPGLAAALALLAWPPEAAPEGLDLDLLEAAGNLARTLAPRAGSRVGWRGSPTVECSEPPQRRGRICAGEAPLPGGGRQRVWRRFVPAEGTGAARDEVQLLLEGADPTRLKLWAKVGYRSAEEPDGGQSPLP